MVVTMFACPPGLARARMACLFICGALACRASHSPREQIGPEPSSVSPARAMRSAEAEPARAAGATSAARLDSAESHPVRAGQIVAFEGTCDASGAIALDERHFAVADDEDNVLRVYDAEAGGLPRAAFELSSALSLEPGAEADIEAATRIGDEAYFLTSHGRTRSGKVDPSRFLFFATTVPEGGRGAQVVGSPYRSLVRDLLVGARDFPVEFHGALERGQLELEGMTATREGAVWIGFRSPIPGGHALVLRLANPGEVVRGGAPRFDEGNALDLGGLGIRGLSSWRGSYLIIGGPAGDGGPFELYRSQGMAKPVRVDGAELAGLGPEGFFSHDQRDEIMLLSDDGTRLVDGMPCKRLDDPARKGFRGVWLRLATT